MNGQAGQAITVPARQGRVTRLRVAFVNRDWIGVAIEVAIVTLSILIAFEVEQWGERQRSAVEER